MFISDDVLANSSVEKEVDATSGKALMKSESETEKLDRLLRDWLEAQQPTSNEQEALHGRIVTAVQESLQQPSLAKAEPSSHSQSSRYGWMYLATAAAGLLVCLVFWSPSATRQKNVETSQSRSDAVSQANRPPEMARISIDAKARLLAEMQQVFDNRVAWIAETDGQMWFELGEGEKRSTDKRMVLRLEVLTTDSVRENDSTGRVWAMDLILENEHVAEVRTLATNPEVMVWPYILPDGSVAIETCLDLPGSNAMKSQTTSVFSFDENGTAQQTRSLQGYVLRQSLQLLDQSVT